MGNIISLMKKNFQAVIKNHEDIWQLQILLTTVSTGWLTCSGLSWRGPWQFLSWNCFWLCWNWVHPLHRPCLKWNSFSKWSLLCSFTQISTGEARKVKHIAYFFNGIRCTAALPGMLRMMSFYNLVILCCLMGQALPTSSRIFCFYLSLPLKTLNIASRP